MNLLLTGAWNTANEYISKLEQQGHNVIFMQYENETLPCSYDWVEGVVANGLFLHHSIQKFTNLKYIQLTSAGFERVPIDYVQEHNIDIYNARGVYSIPMAEFAIAGVLQIYKQLQFFRNNQEEHVWNKHRGLLELYEKNICIVGCGNVGNECAKRFKAFGCRVIGIDICPRVDDNYNEMLELGKLETVLPEVDVLILTLPLSEQTMHLIDDKKFDLLKEGSVLVNIARGGIVDTAAMIQNFGKLGGAVLDVFEQEPLDSGEVLWDLKNVIITPHNSFVGENNPKRLADVIMNNLNII